MIRTAALLAVAVAAATCPAQDRPPTRRQATVLCAEYLGLDGRTEAGRARQLAILARLDAYPPLRTRDIKDWKRAIEKSMRKLRKLEKSGRNWFYDPDDKARRSGFYIVGGETKRPKGLLIGLHGGGAGAGSAGSSHGMYDAAAKKLGWVSVCPEVLVKTEHGWTDSGTDWFVVDLVDAALRTWKIDPNHVYFAGHSMGGYGSWTLGAWHADRVAGIAPSAGAPTPILERGKGVVDIIEGVIPNLRNVRVCVFQSTDDPRVPPEPNQVATRKLGEARERWGGFDFDYWEVGNRGHGLPDGGAKALLDRIAEAAREPVPEKIVWQPTRTEKRQFYWLQWEDPRQLAIVEASLDRDANAVHVVCDKARVGLAVLLDDRVVDTSKEVVITLNGDEVWRGTVEARLPALLETSAHSDPELAFVARIPLFGPDDRG